MTSGTQRGNVQIFVEDFNVSSKRNIAGGDHGRSAHIKAQNDWFVTCTREHDVFDVEDHLSDVFADTF